MAYQPKSYRKFVATAATATLVASAVTPAFAAETGAAASFTDVSDRYQEAVTYLVDNKITLGLTPETYGTQQSIKRVDAAVMIAKALNLELDVADRPDSGFKDVPDRAKAYVDALKAEGFISGKTATSFGSEQEITRGEIALILAKAYGLKGTSDKEFSDVSSRYQAAVEALVAANITQGKTATTFGTTDAITRGEFAIFLFKAEKLTPATPVTGAAISSVTAINDTKLELTFKKAIDEDLAVEIEKSGQRVVVYDGGQTVHDTDVIASQTISFNEDRTKATVILADDDLQADIKYTVALLDGDDNEVASVLAESASLVLKKGAAQPEVSVSADQKKFIVKFKEKMDESALDVGQYNVYEGNTLVGTLADFVVETVDGDWVDSTTKTAVEFNLDAEAAEKLLAGKTYKVLVDPTVETDNGETLSATERTITVKTPTVSEAQPEAKIARVVDGEIVVTFDKDLDLTNLLFNNSQVTVKSPSGQNVQVTNVVAGDTPKEVNIQVSGTLDTDLTYTIGLPANGVANAYFPNASNLAVSALKAQAQKDVEVSSVSAKLVRQAENKELADLVLTFDQRVDVEALQDLTGDAIVIKDGSDTYEIASLSQVGLYPGDTTGKTVVIKDVTSAFALDGEGFAPESGTSYTVELAEGTVQTENGVKVNQESLEATFGGISVTAPALDKVRLDSAQKIVVEFEEDIDASNLSATDISVQGFERYSNGNFTEEATSLSGSSQLKYSVSGKTLTITPANSNVKFATSDVEDLVVIDADSIKGKDSGVENTVLDSDILEASDVIDRAAPVMVGATKLDEDTDTLTVTYSEPVEFKGTDTAAQAAQFTVDNASKDAYGIVADEIDNTIAITFNEADTFRSDVDLAEVEVIYTRNLNALVRDAKGNEQASQTITGVKKVLIP